MTGELDISLMDQLGVLGYPLLVCGCLILAIVVERLLYFASTYPPSKQLVERLVKEKQLDLPESLGKKIANSRFGAVFLELYENRELPVKEREDLCLIRLMDIEQSLLRYLPILKILATISPLLGLLGTVLGMINSFQMISSVDKPITPSLVSGGIAQALLTTAVGLILAILALIPFSLFQQRANKILRQLSQQLSLINLHLEKQSRARKTKIDVN